MCFNIWKSVAFLSRYLFLVTTCVFCKKTKFNIWEKSPFSAEGTKVWDVSSILCRMMYVRYTVSWKKERERERRSLWKKGHISYQVSERHLVSIPQRTPAMWNTSCHRNEGGTGVSWLSDLACPVATCPEAPRPASWKRPSHLIPGQRGLIRVDTAQQGNPGIMQHRNNLIILECEGLKRKQSWNVPLYLT